MTAQVDALGTLRFLDAIREVGLKQVKFYQASTSELYGKVQEIPQNEKTPFYPRSPYGVAKLYGYWIIVNYREAYNLFASNGILFNHESPRRGETFVTRKITRAATRILCGLQNDLSLGNLHSKRDWGFAPEYCEGMWRILQHKTAEDFVLATGLTKTVREFVELTFSNLGINLKFVGEGVEESGIIDSFDKLKFDEVKNKFMGEGNRAKFSLSEKIKVGEKVVKVNPQYYRPSEVDLLIGDATKAKEILGWEAKTKFEDLVKLMTDADLELVLRRGY